MAIFKGGALRLLQTALYALTFCCAAIILGIFSYFLAILADNNLDIPTRWKAVEGISGVAVLYTLATTLLTCCLAGIAFLSILGLILDILFMGGFIAMAILTRSGANRCSGNVRTPLGNGPSNGRAVYNEGNITYSPNLGTACKLNTAVFAVSIIGAVLFLITALMQLALMRHHKKEKRFGPGPDNDYTSGTTKKRGLFAKKNKTSPTYDHAEKGVAPVAAIPATTRTVRPSHDTAYSGNTAVGANPTVIQKEGLSHDGHAPHVGYNPHERTTGTMPHSYDNERSTGTMPHSYDNERSTGTIPASQNAIPAGAIPSVHGGYYTTPTTNARDF